MELERNEKQSSIEVSRNAKGEYSFKVKIYYDDGVKKSNDVVDEIERIMKNLKTRFN